MRNPVEFLTDLVRDYGDVSFFRLCGQRIVNINDPELVQEVLVAQADKFIKTGALERLKQVTGDGLITSDGPFYRSQRKLLQPAFTPKSVAAYGTIASEFSSDLGTSWRPGETLDMARAMQELSLKIILRILFGVRDPRRAGEIRSLMDSVLEYVSWKLSPFSGFLEHLPLPKVRRFRTLRSRLEDHLRDLLQAWRDGGAEEDILSLLLSAREQGIEMTDRQVLDQVMTLFIAGHETVASALSWTWYAVSQHPDVESKLLKEWTEVLSGRLPTAEDMPRLEFTRKVLCESMRLFPPVWGMSRRATQPVRIGSYRILEGTTVGMSQYTIHRHPRYWPDPERFDPERWTSESKARRPKFAYFPFGGGPRVCMGESLSWMEMTLVFVTLARDWKAVLVPGHSVKARIGITMRPEGLRMTLHRRSPR